ncbi:hypothetical protein J3R82DRAFT_11216 [Butyriboletus roseoflavus]|nr:hypothetical protein J3R82DRAFT_11216 [Butyriboletus roseoflavus]
MGRHASVRTAATFTLLQLCGVHEGLQIYLLHQGILDIFIKQLQFKDSALLAAYALTQCLTYRNFRAWINRDHLIAGYIVNMIRLDYFDEAIGVTEGLAIFEEFLRCDELKQKILGYDITTLLEHKLGAGKPAEMRMSLIYVNIFRIHGEHSLTRNLVERGLFRLGTNQWKTQRAGVAILCSLAQTWFGVEALKPIIPTVGNMLLPNHDTENQQAAHDQSNLPSSLLGPAFVLRVMAQNETLRDDIRQSTQYGILRHLYLFGDLLGVQETPLWRVRTPTRDDVLNVISQMITSVDSVQGSTDAGFILPRVQHWDRVARVVRHGVVGAIVVPCAVAVLALLMVVGAILLVAPVVGVSQGRRVSRFGGSDVRGAFTGRTRSFVV